MTDEEIKYNHKCPNCNDDENITKEDCIICIDEYRDEQKNEKIYHL